VIHIAPAPGGLAARLTLRVSEGKSYRLQYLSQFVCIGLPPLECAFQWIDQTNFTIISGGTLDGSGVIYATNSMVVLEDPVFGDCSRFYRVIEKP